MGQKRIFWYNRWCRHHTTSKNYLNKGPTSKLTEFFSRYDFTESLHVFTSNGQLSKLKVISRDSSPGLGIRSRGGSRPSDKEGGRGHLDPETKLTYPDTQRARVQASHPLTKSLNKKSKKWPQAGKV